ncbi:MAG: hypothetical protein AAFU70_09925, partial [Planctomycetota bacterium]
MPWSLDGARRAAIALSTTAVGAAHAQPVVISGVDLPSAVLSTRPIPLTISVDPNGDTVVGVPRVLFRFRADRAFETTDMTPAGGDLFTVELPRAQCGDVLEYAFEVEGAVGGLVTLPTTAINPPLSAAIGTEIEPFATIDFESADGWTTVSNAVEGFWELGVPLNNGRGDPPADADGSGNAFLTENDPLDPNSDVDEGSVTLISPVYDLSLGGTFTYSFWLNDTPDGHLSVGDGLFVEISTDGGVSYTRVRSLITPAAAWREDTIAVAPGAQSRQFRVRFIASDLGIGSVIEAGIDNVRIDTTLCVDPPICAADLVTPFRVL